MLGKSKGVVLAGVLAALTFAPANAAVVKVA